jgi:hypothetical protein
MDFNIRKLDENDYDQTLVGWWNDWGWTPPSKDFLPDNGAGGMMVLDGDEPVCAGFIYITNSKVAWVDWIISNKNYRKKPQRRQALEFLIETLTDMSQNTGYKYIYALIKNPSLIETYEKFGYLKGDTYTSEMIKIS